MVKLLFNTMRSATSGAALPYKYNLTTEQTEYLKALSEACRAPEPTETPVQPDRLPIFQAVHSAILSLFSHELDDPDDTKFSSPVTSFFVLTAFTQDGNLKKASELTQTIAKLVFINRCAQLRQIYQIRKDRRPDGGPISFNEYVGTIQASRHILTPRAAPMPEERNSS
jgi:hypothetical protein